MYFVFLSLLFNSMQHTSAKNKGYNGCEMKYSDDSIACWSVGSSSPLKEEIPLNAFTIPNVNGATTKSICWIKER